MIPYYILAIEDETDRAYMTALFFQYQKLMYSTIQKVTNDHWLIDDIFQTSFEHLIGKIDLLKDLDRNRLVNYLIVTCRNTAYNMCRSYSAHITEDLDEYATIRIRKRTCCGRFRYGAYFCRGNEEDGNV